MLKSYIHKNFGTCSKSVTIVFDDSTHIIDSVKFEFGCPGNTTGVAKLCAGRKLEEVYELLKGVQCGNRLTSCPDQLALAIKDVLNQQNYYKKQD